MHVDVLNISCPIRPDGEKEVNMEISKFAKKVNEIGKELEMNLFCFYIYEGNGYITAELYNNVKIGIIEYIATLNIRLDENNTLIRNLSKRWVDMSKERDIDYILDNM